MPGEPLVGELLMPAEDRGTAARSARERARLQALARLMDSVFEVPGLGWRFGLDPLLGLVPVAGDLLAAGVSVYLLAIAAKMRIPRGTLLRMALNVALDFTLGSIPLVGSVFDFVWKADTRNLDLLDRALASGREDRRRQNRSDWLFILVVLGGLTAVCFAIVAAAALSIVWLVQTLLTPPAA